MFGLDDDATGKIARLLERMSPAEREAVLAAMPELVPLCGAADAALAESGGRGSRARAARQQAMATLEARIREEAERFNFATLVRGLDATGGVGPDVAAASATPPAEPPGLFASADAARQERAVCLETGSPDTVPACVHSGVNGVTVAVAPAPGRSPASDGSAANSDGASAVANAARGPALLAELARVSVEMKPQGPVPIRSPFPAEQCAPVPEPPVLAASAAAPGSDTAPPLQPSVRKPAASSQPGLDGRPERAAAAPMNAHRAPLAAVVAAAVIVLGGGAALLSTALRPGATPAPTPSGVTARAASAISVAPHRAPAAGSGEHAATIATGQASAPIVSRHAAVSGPALRRSNGISATAAGPRRDGRAARAHTRSVRVPPRRTQPVLHKSVAKHSPAFGSRVNDVLDRLP